MTSYSDRRDYDEDAAPDAKSEGDRGNIAVAVDQIRSSLGALQELISDLEDQLRPIRRPIPTSDESDEKSPRAESSELAEELRSIDGRIVTLCRRVTELQHEVDL